jgi:hypothetical protein
MHFFLHFAHRCFGGEAGVNRFGDAINPPSILAEQAVTLKNFAVGTALF